MTQKGTPDMRSTTKKAIDILLRVDYGLDSFKVQKFFSELAKETRRMKGFIQLDDGWWYFLDSVNGSLSLTKTSSTYAQTRIVVIFKEEIEEKIVNRAENLWASLIT